MSDDTRLEFSEMLGRRVRMGSWEDQKISTYRKIREAIAEGRWEDASELADYFTDEANVCFSLYRQWVSQLQSFLRSKGVSKEELEEIDRNIRAKLTLRMGVPGTLTGIGIVTSLNSDSCLLIFTGRRPTGRSMLLR